MAFGALRFLVLAQQRVFGLLVMVEGDFFPFDVVVTGFALGTEFTLVPLLPIIVLLVTLVAKLGRILEFVIQMASCTFNFFVLALQIKFGFAVVEMGRLPVFFLVAILALRPQRAFVLIRLFMTAVAFGWRFPIFLHWGMAVLAENFAV